MKIKNILMKPVDFIADLLVILKDLINRPFICAGCGKLKFDKTRMQELHRTGKWVTLCKDCWHIAFAPFSQEYKDENENE